MCVICFTYSISIPHSIYYYFIGLRNYFSGVVPELYRRKTEDSIQNGRFLLAMKRFNQLSSVGLAVLDSNSKLRCSKSTIFWCDMKGMKDLILLHKGSFPNIRVHSILSRTKGRCSNEISGWLSTWTLDHGLIMIDPNSIRPFLHAPSAAPKMLRARDCFV